MNCEKNGVLNVASLGQNHAGGPGKFEWKIFTAQKAVNWLFIQFSIKI